MNTFAKIRFFFIIPLVCVVLFSCDPNEKLPPETILEFVGYQRFGDSTGITALNLQVKFQDGDGNIGTNGTDTNLFIHVFDKKSLTDSVYEPMQTQTLPQKDFIIRYAIPILSTAPNASVRGTLDIRINEVPRMNLPGVSEHGIVRFKIYMLDRNSDTSNIVTTPDISIR